MIDAPPQPSSLPERELSPCAPGRLLELPNPNPNPNPNQVLRSASLNSSLGVEDSQFQRQLSRTSSNMDNPLVATLKVSSAKRSHYPKEVARALGALRTRARLATRCAPLPGMPLKPHTQPNPKPEPEP